MSAEPFLPGVAGREGETAVRSHEDSITWAGLETRVMQVANGLQALGLDHRDRLAVLSANRVEYVELILGGIRAGAHVVPVNWHLTAAEAAYILADSGAKALFCDDTHTDTGRAAAKAAGLEQVFVVGEDYAGWRDAQGASPPPNVDAGAPMFYTSGTTGRPKGVINRARETTVTDSWALWRATAKGYGYQEGGNHLLACPAYHAAPFMHIILAITMRQGVVTMPRFDAEEFLRLVDAYDVRSTHVVPMQMQRLLQLPEAVRERYDTSSLVNVVHGAAPCPGWVKRGLIEWLGPKMLEYYAFSEGAGQCFAWSSDWLERPGTVGRPPEGTELLIANDAGEALPPGEVGTLYFRRPGKSGPEYHNAPEKTASSMLPGGWFTVGDVGWQDADGYVFLADRKIDMVISGGVNIYPAEVEACLSEHPAVADCAVFGIPDDDWGESVKAAVMLEPDADADAVTEEAIIDWCRERIATFKCPRSVDFHTEFPRQASGKLLKRELRAPYWEGRERRI